MKKGYFIGAACAMAFLFGCQNQVADITHRSAQTTSEQQNSAPIRARATGVWSAPVFVATAAPNPTSININNLISPTDESALVYWQWQTGLQIIASGIPIWSDYTVLAIDGLNNITNANPIPAAQQTQADQLDIKYQFDLGRLQAIWSSNGEIFRRTSTDSLGGNWLPPDLLGTGYAPRVIISPRELVPTTPGSLQEVSYFWQDINQLKHAATFLAAGMGGSGIRTSTTEISASSSNMLGEPVVDENNRGLYFMERSNLDGSASLVANQINPGFSWQALGPQTPSGHFDSLSPIHTAALSKEVYLLIGADKQQHIIAQQFHPLLGWQLPIVISEASPVAAIRDSLEVAYNVNGEVQVAWISHDTVSQSSQSRVYGNRFSAAGAPAGWQGVKELSASLAASRNTELSLAMSTNGNTALLWQQHTTASTQIHFAEYSMANGWAAPLVINSIDRSLDPTTLIDKTSVAINNTGLVNAIWVEYASGVGGSDMSILMKKRH